MEFLAKCPKCDAGLPVPAANAPASITCGGCGREIPLTVSDALREGRAVDRCPVCAGGDFYIRKDFDPKIGLGVVIVGALISAGFYWYGRDLKSTYSAAYDAASTPIFHTFVVKP